MFYLGIVFVAAAIVALSVGIGWLIRIACILHDEVHGK
jgi:hypothetical protein